MSLVRPHRGLVVSVTGAQGSRKTVWSRGESLSLPGIQGWCLKAQSNGYVVQPLRRRPDSPLHLITVEQARQGLALPLAAGKSFEVRIRPVETRPLRHEAVRAHLSPGDLLLPFIALFLKAVGGAALLGTLLILPEIDNTPRLETPAPLLTVQLEKPEEKTPKVTLVRQSSLPRPTMAKSLSAAPPTPALAPPVPAPMQPKVLLSEKKPAKAVTTATAPATVSSPRLDALAQRQQREEKKTQREAKQAQKKAEWLTAQMQAFQPAAPQPAAKENHPESAEKKPTDKLSPLPALAAAGLPLHRLLPAETASGEKLDLKGALSEVATSPRINSAAAEEQDIQQSLKVAAQGVTRAPADEEYVVSGGLTSAQVERSVTENIDSVRTCYENALRKKTGLKGKMLLSFLIGKSGRVEGARIAESSFAEPHLEKCIVTQVRSWRFPKPTSEGQVSVSYPFVFKSVGVN